MYLDKQKITIGVISAIAIIGFLVGAYVLTNQQTKQDFPQVNVLSPNDHITWSPEKKNILVEYSDLQCPACKQFHTILKQFTSSDSADFDITKKVTLVYRHYPLTQLHPHAQQAAYAAEAAGNQGKFFEYSDVLFENQEAWAKLSNVQDTFIKYAKDLGLDTEKFKADMATPETAQRVATDIQSGNAAQIKGTPTFFLNGKKLSNITSFDEFKTLLKQLPWKNN